MSHSTRHVRIALCSLILVAVSGSAAAQAPPPTPPAQQPGEVTLMQEGARKKLDLFLKKAVDNKRPELLQVLVRLADRDGAEARVRDLLTKLGLKADRTFSDGRLLLATLKAAQLLDVAASDDVSGVSFDAIVKPQGPGH